MLNPSVRANVKGQRKMLLGSAQGGPKTQKESADLASLGPERLSCMLYCNEHFSK